MEVVLDNWHTIKTSNGTEISLMVFVPEQKPSAVLLFLPALGVKAKLYKNLGQQLAQNGIVAIVLEQRGHGESPYRPKRGQSFGYDDYLQEDIPAVRSWIKEQFPSLPFYMGGHSLGGHLSCLTAAINPEDLKGILHIACVFPHYKFYTGFKAIGIWALCALIPFVSWLLGYYPGNRLGFGGREYRQLMMDWREWGLRSSYNFGPYHDAEEKMKAYRGDFLSLAIDGDTFASEAATAKPRGVMASANLTTKQITAKEQGEYLGHFDWARQPNGIVSAITRWINA